MESIRKIDKPIEKVPAKKRTSLRDAIKSTGTVTKTEPEDNTNTTDTTTIQSMKSGKTNTKKKHQGKAKTFKRKTQRPGRI